MFNFKLHSFSLGNFILQHQNINFKYLTWRRKGTLFYNALFYLLLSGKLPNGTRKLPEAL